MAYPPPLIACKVVTEAQSIGPNCVRAAKGTTMPMTAQLELQTKVPVVFWDDRWCGMRSRSSHDVNIKFCRKLRKALTGNVNQWYHQRNPWR